LIRESIPSEASVFVSLPESDLEDRERQRKQDDGKAEQNHDFSPDLGKRLTSKEDTFNAFKAWVIGRSWEIVQSGSGRMAIG
jgi:hypothetical protein